MATKITEMLARRKADLAEQAFFSLDKVIRRTEEYGITIPDFEILQKAHVLLGAISIRATRESEMETKELKKKAV